jgi:hypothetical protein
MIDERTSMTPSAIHPSVTIDIGEEVLDTIARAAKHLPPGVLIIATGEVEDAEILVAQRSGERVKRALMGPSDLVSVTGVVEAGGVELRALLARDGEVVGGPLVRALSVSVRYAFVSALETPRTAPTPETDMPPPPPPPPATVLITPPPAPAPPIITPPPAAALAPSPRPTVPSSSDLSTALPPKIHRKAEERDEFPEENDVVTHFHFGRCIVLTSDGERLRLQQEKDSRVREVALSMLKITDPTILPDGRKHWELGRKN